MTNLTLVVENSTSLKHQVLKNLQSHDGKYVSAFCAIRNIEDTEAAFDALHSLIADGLVESQTHSEHMFVLYRYRSELPLLRKYEHLQTAIC